MVLSYIDSYASFHVCVQRRWISRIVIDICVKTAAIRRNRKTHLPIKLSGELFFLLIICIFSGKLRAYQLNFVKWPNVQGPEEGHYLVNLWWYCCSCEYPKQKIIAKPSWISIRFNKRNCANTNVTFYKAWPCAIVNVYHSEQILISNWESIWLGYKKQLLSISLQVNFFYPSSDDWSLSILSMARFPCSGALIALQISIFK